RDLRASFTLAELAGDAHHVRQLHRALDERMARQDLLDERRAGARQADDENRIRRWAANARASCEEIASEHFLRAAHVLAQFGSFVANSAAAAIVALRVVLERRGIVARVLERLAHREVEVIAVLVDEIGARELSPHGGEIGIGEAEGLEIREAPVRLA